MRTLRTLGIASSAAALLLSATVAFAHEHEEPATVPHRVIVLDKNPKLLNRPLTTASTTHKAVLPVVRERMQTTLENASLRLNTASTTREERGETARARMQTMREQAQARVKLQREKALKRVADIRDTVKQQMAERLAGQFESLNTKWTDHFMQRLDHYEAMLEKIQGRVTIAETNGREVGATNAAIQSAESAITDARTQVTAQAARTYTLDTSVIPTTTATTTEKGQGELVQGLRTSFKKLHDTLFRDLSALRDGPMTEVREAMQSALMTLGSISGVGEGRTSATTTTSNE